jgi:hypothetical protein
LPTNVKGAKLVHPKWHHLALCGKCQELLTNAIKCQQMAKSPYNLAWLTISQHMLAFARKCQGHQASAPKVAPIGIVQQMPTNAIKC